MILRVKKVLVGDSDFSFVHAIASDGAEYKMELPVSLGRTLKRDALIQVDVKAVSVPDAMNAVSEANRAVSSATTSTFGQRSNARTSGINHGAPAEERSVTSAGTGTLGRRAVTSKATSALGQRAPRQRMSSPDPRGPKSNSADPLRRLLGL